MDCVNSAGGSRVSGACRGGAAQDQGVRGPLLSVDPPGPFFPPPLLVWNAPQPLPQGAGILFPQSAQYNREATPSFHWPGLCRLGPGRMWPIRRAFLPLPLCLAAPLLWAGNPPSPRLSLHALRTAGASGLQLGWLVLHPAGFSEKATSCVHKAAAQWPLPFLPLLPALSPVGMSPDSLPACGARSQSPTLTLQSTSTHTQSSSSSSDGGLFRSRPAHALPPAEDGRVEPYVDFAEFYRLWSMDHGEQSAMTAP